MHPNNFHLSRVLICLLVLSFNRSKNPMSNYLKIQYYIRLFVNGMSREVGGGWGGAQRCYRVYKNKIQNKRQRIS